MLKPFKQNVLGVKMIERLMHGSDAASRQIRPTLTTYSALRFFQCMWRRSIALMF